MSFNPEPTIENPVIKIKRIKEYIDVHLTENIGLLEIAEEFEISRYYLCHLFKKHTGYTLVQYINNQRIYLARCYHESGMNLLEAATRSGFRNYSSFYRVYRSKFGISPQKSQKLKDEISKNNWFQ